MFRTTYLGPGDDRAGDNRAGDDLLEDIEGDRDIDLVLEGVRLILFGLIYPEESDKSNISSSLLDISCVVLF